VFLSLFFISYINPTLTDQGISFTTGHSAFLFINSKLANKQKKKRKSWQTHSEDTVIILIYFYQKCEEYSEQGIQRSKKRTHHFFFCGAGDGTQGLVYARQTLNY
jgi:hypothetical protein